jgi:two-component system alkaline phosphatase synthesis response regulator PhoP
MAKTTEKQKKAEPAQSDKPATILVVDDNEQNLELLIAYLEDIPCRTIPAKDGIVALEIIKKSVPDLVLLDVMMPRMSGFEVCRRIKSNPATASLPVIMVTALNELGDIERAIESGTDDFLSKPINKWELTTRVKTMLKLKHLSDELERTLAYLSEVEKQSK